jgi:hypothetical protein
MLVLLSSIACHGPDPIDSDTAAPQPIDRLVPALSAHASSQEEWETALAMNDAGAGVASWTQWPPQGEFDLGVAFTTDGGASFDAPIDVPSPDGAAADSVLEPLGDGFLLAWFDHGGAAEHVYAATGTAADGFGPPLEVTDPADGGGYDKPWLARLPDGSLLLTYLKTVGSQATGVAAHTSDGTTWTYADIASDRTWRNLYYACASDTGRVWVTYQFEGAIGLRWSDDDGATWTSDDAVVSAETVPFAEPVCVAHGDRVYVLYGLSGDPDGEQTGVNPRLNALRLASTVDGAAFDRVIVPLDASPFVLAPQLVMEPDGTLDVTYFAGDDEGDVHGTFRRLQIAGGDVGASVAWVDDVPMVGDRSSDLWIGDYSGLVFVDGSLAASFIDDADGFGHVSFARITP